MRCEWCGYWAENMETAAEVSFCPDCRGVECAITDYEFRCRELEAEGLTRSDAQSIADMEGVKDE